jgi:hypothetical protein
MLKTVTVSLMALMFVSNTPASIAEEPVRKHVQQIVKAEPKTYARQELQSRGFARSEFNCLHRLWTMESNWNPKSKNKKSTAFGIAQMLTEKSKDPITQVKHGLKYIDARYGSPCVALRHEFKEGWY